MRTRRPAPLALAAAFLLPLLPGPGARADDAYEPNDTLATAHFLGGPLDDPGTGVLTLLADDAVLEAGAAADAYSFTAFSNAPIAVRVEPLAGAAGAADARNLGLRLWRRTSAQDQTFSLLAQIDFNAAGSAEYHPPIPYALAGFLVAEVYSADGAAAEQPYRLRISNEAIAPSVLAELEVTNGAEPVADGGTVSFGEVPLGESASLELTVTNLGDAILEVEPPALTGDAASDFSVTFEAGAIAPGASAALGIELEPTAAGVREATLRLDSNDPEQPSLTLLLSGAGIDPDPGPATLSLSLGLARLSGLALAPEIEGVAVPILLELGLDPNGRPVCTGSCSIAEEPVRVEAKPLKWKKKTGVWIYRLKLFGTTSARFAKLRGELGSGLARLRLEGPEGNAKLEDVPVSEDVELGVDTALQLFAQLDAGGALSGSGTIESGLGNDATAPPATLTGTVSETRLAFKLKSKPLRRKIAFKGKRVGDAFVGKLTYEVAPAEGKLSGHEIPAALFLEP